MTTINIARASRQRRHARLVSSAVLLVWIAALIAIGLVLVRLGHGPLQTPRLQPGWASLRRWAETHDAPTIVMAGLRALALALDVYLLATTTLGGMARLVRSIVCVRMLDRVTPPSVRRLLSFAIGGVLLSAPITIPSLRAVPGVASVVSAPPTLRRIEPSPPARPSPPPIPAAVGGPIRPPDPMPLEPPTAWVVRPGDNMWLIARRVLEERSGGPVTAPTIVPFWHLLIDDNRDRAPDPNRIFPRQSLRIPAPP